MIVVSILKDEVREGKRRGKGKQIHSQIVFAVDKYNLVIGHRTGNSPVMGKAFFSTLVGLASRLKEFEVDKECARKIIRADLSRIFKRKPKKNIDFKNMNDIFSLSKLRDDSTGAILLYEQLKNKGLSSGD